MLTCVSFLLSQSSTIYNRKKTVSSLIVCSETRITYFRGNARLTMPETLVADMEVVAALRGIIDKLEGNERKEEKLETGDEGHW